MDFDPLSLFTPEANKTESLDIDFRYDIKLQEEAAYQQQDEIQSDDHLQPLHVLDLPLLQLKPPAEVLILILKLLSPDEVYNFAAPESINDEEQAMGSSKTFDNKNISNDLLETALEWLTKYCHRFDDKLKLLFIPYLCPSLKKNYDKEYNGWLTRIISSQLSWVENPDHQTTISKEASLRLSENCGRTAQPEITRKIGIPNLEKYLLNCEYIKLKEPSLTNDNLGLKTWGSSLIMANRLINKNKTPDNYLLGSVLELGSGTGLVGIVSSILGYDTYLTDLIEIIPNLKENIKLNNIDAKVDELNWCDPSSFLSKYGTKKFNTIILSDPIYSSKHPLWVVEMIEKFLDYNTEARVLIQIPLRPSFEAERNLLWVLMSKDFKETEHEIENGNDDFGEMEFCFKKFIRKKSITK